ncbi:MAG: CBS domain-containing protein [Phototrophicaceae bacterium]
MNAIDIMTENPITIQSDKSLRAALQVMDDNQIKHLPVMSKQGHVLGILSDRDCRHALNSPYILRERWQDENLTIHLKVRNVMTSAPIVVEPDTSSEEVARLMLNHQIGCLPVMRAETLVGIVTRSDILVAFMNIHRHYEQIIATMPELSVQLSTNTNNTE